MTFVANIKKIRFVSGFRSRNGHEYREIHYTVEGSDKVYKHNLYGLSNVHFWFNDEVFHWLRTIEAYLKDVGDGTKCKTLYDHDNRPQAKPIRVEVYYGRGGILGLSKVA